MIQDVNAHANPVSYSPKADITIGGNEKLPENVVIIYTERPEQKASHIRVTNSNNERVDKNNFAVSSTNPRELSVSLDTTKLIPCVYTVSWLVLSKDDGHISKGSYVFTISSTTNESPDGVTNATSNQFVDSSIVNNVNITTKISPFYSGTNNNFTVFLFDSDGKAPTNIKTVFLVFNNKQAGLGPISAELTKTNEGLYEGSGGYLSQPGEWDMKIVIQRTDAYDLNHNIAVTMKNQP